MLTIRMQRTGRKGHAMFRVVVQDSRRTPSSGKVVAYLGSYDPHTKSATLTKDKAEFYLEHGAQPSDRVARLLKSEGLKLPKWVNVETKEGRAIRNPEKLRKNRPAEAEAPAEPEAEVPVEAEVEAPAEVAEAPADAEATEEKTEPEAKAAAEPETAAEETPAESENTEESTEKPEVEEPAKDAVESDK